MVLNPQTLGNGQEQYESFPHPHGLKSKTFWQYDYRRTDGTLFSCVGTSLEACRARRDAWLRNKKGV